MEIIDEVTNEMADFYSKRTRNHIKLVSKCAENLVKKNIDLKDLLKRVQVHDISKWSYPEYEPYVFTTWKYKCAKDGLEFNIPDSIANQMHEATIHHVKSNKHHPEYWDENSTINKEDRDKPPKRMVDGTKMDNISLAEMVCDWTAMGIERGNSAREWADKNINIRWQFTDIQIKLIYKYIDDISNVC